MADQESSTEVFTNDIELYLQLCQEENGWENIASISQSQWNYVLSYIYKHVFKNTDKLRSNNGNTCSYDYELVSNLCNIYIDICYRYNKEISILGFTRISGISEEIIYQWGNNNKTYRDGSNKLTYKNFEIYKKLNRSREESLSNKLADGKQNPVGVIAILNHHYNWSSPYTSDANKTASQRIARESLKAEIEEKGRQKGRPCLPMTDTNNEEN